MYCYLLDRQKKEVIEAKAEDSTIKIFTSMGLKYYEEFPYEAAGYEDPYAFMDDYTLIKLADGFDFLEVVEE